MDGIVDRIMGPGYKPTNPMRYFRNLEFPDPTVLDNIRRYEKDIPEGGIYNPQVLGLPQEPDEDDPELAALTSRVRYQLIRKCLALISYNPDRFSRIPRQADYDDDDEILENADEVDNDTVTNPIAIGDDDEIYENAHPTEDNAASNPDLADGSVLVKKEEDAYDNSDLYDVSDDDEIDNSDLYDASSDSGSSDDSQTFEDANVSYNTAITDYDTSDVGVSALQSTQPENVSEVEKASSPPREPEQVSSEGVEDSSDADDDAEGEDDDYDDGVSPSVRPNVKPPSKTAKRPSKVVKAPRKTTKSNPKTAQAPPRRRKASTGSGPRPTSHLARGGKLTLLGSQRKCTVLTDCRLLRWFRSSSGKSIE